MRSHLLKPRFSRYTTLFSRPSLLERIVSLICLIFISLSGLGYVLRSEKFKNLKDLFLLFKFYKGYFTFCSSLYVIYRIFGHLYKLHLLLDSCKSEKSKAYENRPDKHALYLIFFKYYFFDLYFIHLPY